MKKHLRAVIIACLALCMTVCLAIFAVACQPDNSPKTFTITIVDEQNNPVASQGLGVCQTGGMCYNLKTDENGKLVVDTSTEAWKNSADMHIQFQKMASGYKGFDADGNVYDNNEGPTVDHHKTGSVTLTVKPLTTDNTVDVGIENDERSFNGKTIIYSLTADHQSKLKLEGNANGGEFYVRAYINGSDTPVKYTFNAANTSKTYDIPQASLGKYVNVIFVVQPMNGQSARFTFNTYPIYELGNTLISVSAATLDGSSSYKVFFNVEEANTTFTFSQINDNLAEAVKYPVTVKIGNAEPVIWQSASDILSEYTFTETGVQPIEFSWADSVENPFIGITVISGNSSEDPANVPGATFENPYIPTLGTAFTAQLNQDGEFFVNLEVTEAGSYVITSDSAHASVNDGNDWHDATPTGLSFTLTVTAEELEAGSKTYELLFALTMGATDTEYSVTITKSVA